MKKNNLLLRTNLVLCAFLTVILVITALVNYYSNVGSLKREIERIANLVSESIYFQGGTYLTQHISVSAAMANGSMLKRFLLQEPPNSTDTDTAEYAAEIQEHLNAYTENFGYASAHFISAKTERYYHSSGKYRTLNRGDVGDSWYYRFLESGKDFSFDAGSDKYVGEMYFVDTKIYDTDGSVLGVIGVGFDMSPVEKLLRDYGEKYGVSALLVNGNEKALMNTAERAVMSGEFHFLNMEKIASITAETGKGQKAFWHEEQRDCFVVVRYIKDIDSYLFVENNMSKLREPFERQLVLLTGFTVIVSLAVMFIFNKVILSYNGKLLKQAVSQEMEHYNILIGTIKELYSEVYEFDVTRGIPVGEDTRRHFHNIGIKDGTNFKDAMNTVTLTQIKDEYQEGFAAMFSRENVLEAYYSGIRELNYDYEINDAEHKWVRMIARLFRYASDESVHMIVFSQDITGEKERETILINKAETDPLTGFYNKAAVKERVNKAIEEAGQNSVCAFILADTDYFKSVNDTLGHAAGDRVIKDFTTKMKRGFRDADICGRVGGDEFVVFLQNIPDEDWLRKKMASLSDSLRWKVSDGRRKNDDGGKTVSISASIGVACYPDSGKDFDTLYQNADTALYHVKKNGRNGFAIYKK